MPRQDGEIPQVRGSLPSEPSLEATRLPNGDSPLSPHLYPPASPRPPRPPAKLVAIGATQAYRASYRSTEGTSPLTPDAPHTHGFARLPHHNLKQASHLEGDLNMLHWCALSSPALPSTIADNIARQHSSS